MFEIKTLSNGVRIVLEQIPFVRSISFGIWVANGSRNETPEVNGISHFMEHMLFKGTERRNAKDIADEMDAIGGQINAYTSKEYTCYYTRTLDSHIDIAVDVLADMFFHSKFAEEDIQKEKNVIIEEINMYEDSPEELVHDLLQENIWSGDPLGFPILGTEETISTFGTKTFQEYHQKNYHPRNTVLAIAGNFEVQEMFEKLERYFGHWSAENDYETRETHTGYQPVVIQRTKDIEQIHLCMGFPGIPLGSKDVYALTILNTIFGGGMSSRLFQRIREDKGLAYSVYSYPSNYKNIGLFTIYAGMSVAQTPEVVKLILEQIELMDQKKITEKELYKTKEQLKSNYIIGLESTSSRMTSLGKSELMIQRIQTQDEILRRIDEVTLEQMGRLIHSLLDISQISISAVGKVDGLDFEGMLKQ